MGIALPADDNDFRLFPNPSGSTCLIMLSPGKSGAIRVDVNNSRGEVMLSMAVHHAEGNDNVIELDVSDLPVGLYYVTVRSDTSFSVQKLIIAE